VIIDQLSKYLALFRFSPGESLPLIPDIFHLTLVMNTGIAFGFFHKNPEILLVLISLSIVFLFFYAPRLAEQGWGARMAMGLILGGAVGNWIDRLRVHAVIDFLDFRVWPVFNLADTAISVGVGLYLFKIIFDKSGASPKGPACGGNGNSL